MGTLDLVSSMAYSTRETVQMTYDLTGRVLNMPGILVECGVGAGAQIMAMALHRSGKQIIGFDSFEGIPMAGPNDGTQPGLGEIDPDSYNLLVSSGVTVHSTENVLENFGKAGVGCHRLKLVKGWFQNTLPRWTPTPIALLRLDGDLYESTKVCLSYLYPHVISGGIVIIDDYCLEGCRKAVNEYFGDNMPELHGECVVYFYKK